MTADPTTASSDSASSAPSAPTAAPGPGAPLRYLVGDATALCASLEAGSVATVVTSPPYWGRRAYTDSPYEIGRSGLDEYVGGLVALFDALVPALHPAAVVWLNLGDTAVGSGGSGGDYYNADGTYAERPRYKQGRSTLGRGQWASVPHRVAHALGDHGWLLRSDIVWDKGRMRRESLAHARRPGESHESVFMLTRSRRYGFDERRLTERGNVWHVAPERTRTGHQAPMPLELARRCLEPVTTPGLVLDPFAGSGTSLAAAALTGRAAVGFDIDPGAAEAAVARVGACGFTLTVDPSPGPART